MVPFRTSFFEWFPGNIVQKSHTATIYDVLFSRPINPVRLKPVLSVKSPVGIEIRLCSYQITKFVRDRAHETELGLQSI